MGRLFHLHAVIGNPKAPPVQPFAAVCARMSVLSPDHGEPNGTFISVALQLVASIGIRQRSRIVLVCYEHTGTGRNK